MLSIKSLRISGLVLALAVAAGCASVQTQEAPPGPPPAQNLIGSTDELQLVTELSLNLAREYGGDHVLVVLALDNTLLNVPANADPCELSSLPLTQEDAPDQIGRMQETGLKVIVLTSREPGCRKQTLSQLSDNGLDFSGSAWPTQSSFPGEFIPAGGSRQTVSYQDGVFLAASQDKGLVLETLLKKAGEPYPTLIVMADKNQDNLNAVMKAFSWTSTKVHAWRYTREPAVTMAQE